MIENIKKIELHCHLDGSVRPSTAAYYLNISEEEAIEKMCYKKQVTNLNEYLTKFDLPCSIMQTKEQLSRISYELGCDLKKDNVIYAEVRFAPHKHTNSLSLNEVVESVLDGFNKVDNITIRVILCMMRDYDYNKNHEIIELYELFKDKGVCGIDLAGAESIYPTENFKDLFIEAYSKNIPFTIHAGEADGINSINQALSFNTTRLGHGVRILDDMNILNNVKNNILFEICPTSNIQTGASISYKEHQLKELFNNNCNVCINTDNRTVSNTNLNKEIELMINNQGYSINDIKQMMIKSMNYAFTSKEEIERIKKELI